MAARRSHGALLNFTGSASCAKKLYCFPFAGGNSGVFAGWARLLAPGIEVVGVDMPGHGARFSADPLDTVSAMAEEATQAILQDAPEQAFFYGHSLGAVVAFETALRMKPGVLKHCFFGAARAPQLARPLPVLHVLEDKAFLDAVQSRYGGLPEALFEEPELLAMVLPVLRADFRAYETYTMSSTLPMTCPVTAFYGSQDAMAGTEETRSWQERTDGAFAQQAVDGGHFFMNSGRDVILATIRAAVGKTDEEASRTAHSCPAR